MQQEFNLVLISNTVDDRNTGNHFFNRLSSPLDFGSAPGEWQVGVKKMIYYNNFNSIIDESILVEQKHSISIKKSKNELFSSYWYEQASKDTNLRLSATRDFDDDIIKVHIHPGYFKDSYFGENGWKDITLSLYYSTAATDSVDDEGIITSVASVKNGESTLINHKVDDLFHTINVKLDNVKYDQLSSVKLVVGWWKEQEYKLKPGSYTDIDMLLKTLPTIDGLTITTKSGLANRVEIERDDVKIRRIELKNSLHYTFGFKDSVILAKTATAENIPQLNRGRFAFFIYSNLCQHMKVGNSEVPLLDVITIPKVDFAEPVSIDVYNPIYRPVCMNLVHDVEIGLYSDSGEPIIFNNISGQAKTLLVLHFRKTNHK